MAGGLPHDTSCGRPWQAISLFRLPSQCIVSVIFQYDIEDRMHILKTWLPAGPWGWNRQTLALGLAVALGLFHLYTGYAGLLSATSQRAIHWGLLGAVLFLMHPTRKPADGTKTPLWATLWDVVCFGLFVGSSLYLLLTWEDRVVRVGMPSSEELFWGGVMIVLTLEGARRTAGFFLPFIALLFLAYAYFGAYMPGVFQHRGYSLTRIISYMYTTSSGIYGVPIGVSASFIFLFVLFGAFLNVSGGGRFFMELSFALTGRFVGGTAKTAVVSSALMGTMSGSPIANAVTTGTITIPLMRQSGYSTNMACAIESVASTGGMIMPPVMGAAAFIMAEYLNCSYFAITLAALLPSLVYFIAIYFVVDIYARKNHVSKADTDQIPSLWNTLRRQGHLGLPIVVLIYLLFEQLSPMKSVFWATMLLLALSWLRRDSRITLPRFIEALMDAARNAVPVASACATAGLILGVVSLTGLGSTLSSAIFDTFSSNLFGALVASMVISLVLGMGLPATAVYLIVATLIAPSLINMGVLPVAAHMFVFYFGIISTITPPVALTAYAAAAVGGGDANKVGLLAFRLAFTAYIIPFIFVYSPSLLLVGPLWESLLRFGLSVIAVYMTSVAVIGYLNGQMRLGMRVAAGVGGLLLLLPYGLFDVAGIVLSAAVVIMQCRELSFFRTLFGKGASHDTD